MIGYSSFKILKNTYPVREFLSAEKCRLCRASCCMVPFISVWQAYRSALHSRALIKFFPFYLHGIMHVQNPLSLLSNFVSAQRILFLSRPKNWRIINERIIRAHSHPRRHTWVTPKQIALSASALVMLTACSGDASNGQGNGQNGYAAFTSHHC